MPNDRNEGWRGQYGWGEKGGARSSHADQRYEARYDDQRDDGGFGRSYEEGRDARRGRDDMTAGEADRRFEDYRGRDYGVARGQGYGAWRGEMYGSNYSGNPRAGGSPRGRDFGPSAYPADAERLNRYGDGDDGRMDYGRRRPQEGRSFMQHNPYLEAVTDGGDLRGEHRGRGPRDYKRSDERIREDVN